MICYALYVVDWSNNFTGYILRNARYNGHNLGHRCVNYIVVRFQWFAIVFFVQKRFLLFLPRLVKVRKCGLPIAFFLCYSNFLGNTTQRWCAAIHIKLLMYFRENSYRFCSAAFHHKSDSVLSNKFQMVLLCWQNFPLLFACGWYF